MRATAPPEDRAGDRHGCTTLGDLRTPLPEPSARATLCR